MRAYIETVTRDTAPDERADPPLPARLSSAAGAVLGIAVALLIALLPGGAATGSQLQSAFSASTAEQGVLAVADRAGEARRALPGARGPNARRPDFDNGLIPVAASAALAPAAPAAASPRFVLVRAQRPGRRFSSAQARAPPRA